MEPGASVEVEETHTTIESLAEELRAALPVTRIESLSIHNRSGDPVWMSGDLVGPDEHAIAIEAITVFEVEGSCAFISERLSPELGAALFSIASPRGELQGVVVLVTDAQTIDSLGAARLVSSKVRSILQRLAIVMKSPAASGTYRSVSLPRPAKPRAEAAAPAAPAKSTSESQRMRAVALRSDTPRAEPTVRGERVQTAQRVATPPPAAADNRPAPVREISLHVQQLMKLRSGGRTRRYEVLVRARHSAAGAAMDENLVKALSLRESAAAIDRMVVAELANWLKANPGVWNSDPASFSINLSLGSLLDPEFSRFVAQCLQSSGVAPDTIGFEIQESAALRHREDVARFIQECEKAGCYIVLDDFTMHSDAVPFLGSRAVRVVKVDPKLSTAAMHDRLAQAMVIAISQACKVLGLHCVAKRIDSTASRQWLAAVGIDFAQGYALEDPRPIQTLATRQDAAQKPGVQRPVSRS
jgi:EAL domain-containing protein (putative c-di-GMP-specific phosphodiesterase class I)